MRDRPRPGNPDGGKGRHRGEQPRPPDDVPEKQEECKPMKIAVSSTGPGLQDLVDPRFSRCRFYLIYDLHTGRHESRENTAGMH